LTVRTITFRGTTAIQRLRFAPVPTTISPTSPAPPYWVCPGDIGADCGLVTNELGPVTAYARQAVRDKLIEHKEYITRHGEDMPEIRNWTWPAD
jgi:hypothetical protein